MRKTIKNSKLFSTYIPALTVSAMCIWAICLLSACDGAARDNNAQSSGLEIHWDIQSADYGNSGQTFSVMTLKNLTGDTLLQGDWEIYFNAGSVRVADADSNRVKIGLINGDFFKLAPQRDWQAIPPHDSVQIHVLSRMIRNYTDLPKGFYLLANRGDEGMPISMTLKPFAQADSLEQVLAAQIFDQNVRIQDIAEADLPAIFPTPVSYSYLDVDFELDGSVSIVYGEAYRAEAEFLQEELGLLMSQKLAFQKEASAKAIVLKTDPTIPQEGYTLTIDQSGIHIAASSSPGIFYGIQSLKSMLPVSAWKNKQTSIRLKGITVVDQPRFGHRAVMLDVSRNFQTQAQVKKIIDLLAMYKINVLHFHLNDDEGWRLEIPGLPELTEIGANRGHTLDDATRIVPSYGSGPTAGKFPGSGHYSRADFVDILAYAAARHIRVIPEIETPGHARAAIKAMDARYAKFVKKRDTVSARQYLLRDVNDESNYRSIQNWDDNIMNVALPSTYVFLEKVVDELILMYKDAGAPLATIHFGGDEVPNGVWEKSPVVHELIESEPTVNEIDDLWYYYFTKLNQMLKARSLYLSGWEEIGMTKALVNGQRKMVVEPRLAGENFHPNVWNNLGDNEDLAYRMANAGYQVILTNVSNFYFDLAYSPSFYEPGQYWGGYVDIDKPFRFIPYNYYHNPASSNVAASNNRPLEVLTDFGRKNIVGIQAPLWSEIITSPEIMEYLLIPKIFGLAERAWSKEAEWEANTKSTGANDAYIHDWSTFIHVVGSRELPKLGFVNGGYNYRIPTAGIKSVDGAWHANVQFPGYTIRYTTDGSEPNTSSNVYSAAVSATGKVAFAVFDPAGRKGRTVVVQ